MLKMKKFSVVLVLISFIFLAIAFAGSASAAQSSTPSVCCEKTKDNAYCINTNQDQCAVNFRSAPTACPAASFCALGTCYDSSEGICMENTPRSVCDSNGGTWSEKASSELEQCQLGCCILADQVAFIPKVRCMRLSSLYGVSVDYRFNIKSETECINFARNQDYGACVFQEDFQTKCRFTTREDCKGTESYVINGSVSKDARRFYKDYLCSAEELNTVCARQVSTGCFGGDVYWLDSCGNRENAYSSDKDKSWNKGRILNKNLICVPNKGDDSNCGNCDYLLGTRCAVYDRGKTSQSKPTYGTNICQATQCKDRDGNIRKNGESWCVYEGPVGNTQDVVGSRHYREICMDGKIVLEPCDDFRQEICMQDSIPTTAGDFSAAACRVNRWQDCTTQDVKNCENKDKRDCKWVAMPKSTSPNTAMCVPEFPPGLKFWESGNSSDAETVCGQATLTCRVMFKKKIWEVWSAYDINERSAKCKSHEGTNCDCLDDSWAVKANNLCKSMGDCGSYVNVAGKIGDSGYIWKIDGRNKEFDLGDQQQILALGKRVGVQTVQNLK